MTCTRAFAKAHGGRSSRADQGRPWGQSGSLLRYLGTMGSLAAPHFSVAVCAPPFTLCCRAERAHHLDPAPLCPPPHGNAPETGRMHTLTWARTRTCVYCAGVSLAAGTGNQPRIMDRDACSLPAPVRRARPRHILCCPVCGFYICKLTSLYVCIGLRPWDWQSSRGDSSKPTWARPRLQAMLACSCWPARTVVQLARCASCAAPQLNWLATEGITATTSHSLRCKGARRP